ncbi:hypothetical protein [Phytohabitans kaempferiae]|uniref:Uncharacterized protein n=1 Tax=Phytohabitans kaempferiae TaxID=1620943 RepID=A0ABV6MC17_9ACTN
MTPRLWWRVRDVLPIAEHAAAVSGYRDGSPHQPALLWINDARGDVLESNGTPVWYDVDGQVHHTRAETWIHTPTGTTGNPARVDERDGHLPLLAEHPDGRRNLLDLLRYARDHEVNWLAVDPDPATDDTNTRYQIRATRRDTAPPDATWKRAKVTCPTIGGGTYPALIADGYTALGGVVARFSHDVVQKMATDLVYLNMSGLPGRYPRIRLARGIAIVHTEQADGEITLLVEQDQVTPDATGHYSIGAYQWVWVPV